MLDRTPTIEKPDTIAPSHPAVLSERELQEFLMANGRAVPLAMLTDWRNEGLLPQFTCPGRGWDENSANGRHVTAQAIYIYELLRRRGRAEPPLLSLWLAGFKVPIPRLRRAWGQRARTRQQWIAQHSAMPADPSNHQYQRRRNRDGKPVAPSSASVLLKTALAICGSLDAEHVFDDIPLLREVLEKIVARMSNKDRKIGEADEISGQLLGLVRVTLSLMESSELIFTASDAEIHLAHTYLGIAAGFIQNCLGQSGPNCTPFWPEDKAQRLGPPLYMLILTMLHTGRGQALQRSAAELQKVGDFWNAAQAGGPQRSKKNQADERKMKRQFGRRMCAIWRPLLGV